MIETSTPSIAIYVSTISVLASTVSTIIAVSAFRRQQRTSRLQNLVSVFQRFSNNDDFVEIFALSDSYSVCLDDKSKEAECLMFKKELEELSNQKKYKYLALLEEVAIYAKNFEVIKDTALHLFKFHFYYVYGDHAVSAAFWNNIGSGALEKNKEGWHFQKSFASLCRPVKN